MSCSVRSLLAAIAARSDGVDAAIRTRRRTRSLAGSGNWRPGRADAADGRVNGAQASRLRRDRGRDDRVVRVVDDQQLLGREMAEERHLGHPGRGRDLSHRRLVEALPLEQVKPAQQQTLPRPRELARRPFVTTRQMLATNTDPGNPDALGNVSD